MAPEVWTDENVEQRHNTLKNIVALCPEGQITARVIIMPPGEQYHSSVQPEFVVNSFIEIVTGELGVYEWPWELLEQHSVNPGKYQIRFTDYDLNEIESERDFYVVEFKQA